MPRDSTATKLCRATRHNNHHPDLTLLQLAKLTGLTEEPATFPGLL